MVFSYIEFEIPSPALINPNLLMGGNRPLIPLSFIAEGAKWLVCPDQGMAMVLPAPSYRPAKTARVQGGVQFLVLR